MDITVRHGRQPAQTGEPGRAPPRGQDNWPLRVDALSSTIRALATIDRARESGLVASFLDENGPRARALVLHGEAGIGKTTLWNAVRQAATERGYRVVSAQPTEAEAHLPFVGLADLFGTLADEHRAALPPPQQAALDIALMRADPDATPTQPLALSLAVLELLRRAATSGPIAIAVDDCQWLDAPSASALRFALRRIEREPVVVIAAERTVEAAPLPSLVADLPLERIVRVPLKPIGRDEVDRLLEESLGLQLAPSVLARVLRLSGGNPMHVLEIGRAVQASDGEGGLENLALPASLAGLVRQRIAALSEDACAVVVHAAALAHPTSEQLERALGPERTARGISAAREAEGRGGI